MRLTIPHDFGNGLSALLSTRASRDGITADACAYLVNSAAAA